MGRYPDLRRASAVVRNSSRGIVWQKANRSASIPCADSIRLVSVASGFVQEGSRGGSFHENVGFLAISAWNRGKPVLHSSGRWGRSSAYALGSASMSSSASRSGSSLA